MLETIAEGGKQTTILTEALRDLSFSECKKEEELKKLKKEIAELKANQRKTSDKLKEAMSKLGSANVKNANEKIKRRDEKIEKQETEIKKLTEREEEAVELVLQQADALKTVDKKLECAIRAKQLEQNNKSYYKRRLEKIRKSTAGEDSLLKSIIKEKEEEIKNLQNEKMQLEERMESFISREVKTYEFGEYTQEVREVYQDLMTIGGGVGANNVEKIVREVLEKIGGLKVGRLPKPTFAKYMYLEARGLAQMQLIDELVNKEEKNLTLYSDGTTKYGFSYGTYDISTASGESRILGLREMHEGTASTQLETMKEVLSDIAKMGNQDENSSVAKIVYSIKNLMSDRCIVQKKFNELYLKFRTDILPNVVDGWSELNEAQQAKLANMNDFFCGLHFIVGMADQAEAALKVFDTLLCGDEKVGSLKTKRVFSKGESGTLRLIRTCCKAVQAKGCEKSGRAVQFLTFLQSEKGIEHIPLAPFRGNRFNITFYNGCGIYFLISHLLEFFKHVHSENRLLGAVFDDLQVKSFVAGCRSLGLISKIITAPLWRILEDKKTHVLQMSQKYQHLLACMEKFAENSLEFMKGEVVVFNDVESVKDEIFENLVAPSDEYDVLTAQALELIFAALVVKTKRMLADHLKGGKYGVSSQPEDLLSETQSVVKTNVGPERDFGMLDRLMVEKPRATSIVLEGIVMFNKNQTGTWRDNLPQDKKELVMQLAKKSKTDQKNTFAARQRVIKQNRMKKLSEQHSEEENKARKLRVKKEMLMEEIEKSGGLWANSNEAREKAACISSENQKTKTLYLQIQFRRIVLGATHPDKSVFQLSSKGRKFDSVKLLENLCSILEIAKAEKSFGEAEDDELAELPSRIDKASLDRQKKIYKEEAEKQEASAKRKQSENTSRPRKKQRVESEDGFPETEGVENIPIVQVPEDLTGKRVLHLCRTVSDDDDDDDQNLSAEWYKGTVVEMKGSGRNPWFVIRYDGCDQKYKFKLMKHYNDGILKLVSVEKGDFVGAQILHKLNVGDSDEWFHGKIMNVLPESSPNNPEFTVEYIYDNKDNGDVEDDDGDDDDDDDDEGLPSDCDIEIYPLIEDYLNGDIKFL